MNTLTSTILMLGVPSENADLRYVVPVSGCDPVVYMRHAAKHHVVVSGMEAARVRRLLGKSVSVWTPAELVKDGVVPRAPDDWCLFLVHRLRVRRVSVPRHFPAGALRCLERNHVRVKVLDAPIFPQRQIKRRVEVAHLTYCQGVAVACMKAAVRLIKGAEIDRRGCLRDEHGALTSERVREAIHVLMLRHNCMGFDTIVACGAAAADPHEVGRGVLRANQAIVLDIFPRHLDTGYWGDLSRTVVKGEPSPELRRMYMAVRRAQTLALAHIKAGVSARLIYEMVVDYFIQAGFETEWTAEGEARGFIHSLGHGLGLEVHEAPSLGLRDEPLRAGQVVTVEPGLYYREVGGVRIEDTVLVTARGCRILSPCPYPFRV